MDIDKSSEDVSEFEQSKEKYLLSFLSQKNILMQTLSIKLKSLNGQEQKYLMYFSIVNCITLSKMIKDYQVHSELKRCQIKQKKNALNLLKMTATYHQEKYLLFSETKI